MGNKTKGQAFNSELKTYIESLIDDKQSIGSKHSKSLDDLSKYIIDSRSKNKVCNIIFICTHNSRRSQIAQVWFQTAAYYYGINSLYSFSGGIEETEANINMIKAFERAGFSISNKDKSRKNPTYLINPGDEYDTIKISSKIYSSEKNPRKDFAAVMVCSDADQGCPLVFGADKRISLAYEDPKEYDGTDEEKQAYDDAVKLIGKEMFYLMNRVFLNSKF